MANTTPRGKSSLKPIRSRPEAAERLSALFRSEDLTKLVDVLTKQGSLYLVGGMVRDAFFGEELQDIDLATSEKPATVQATLEQVGFRVIETGIEHGTLTALVDDQPVEITTFRAPSAREQTKFGATIEEDLSGRDFTINAIAFEPTSGEFIDPFRGEADLEQGICRAVGDPQRRFQEDPHRLLRMVRFGPAQGRRVHDETGVAALELAHSIEEVAKERLREELVKILISSFPHDGMAALQQYGLLQHLIPELLPAIGCEQNEWHIHDVWEHTLWVLERSHCDKLVRLAALFHDIGKPATVSTDEGGRRHFYGHEYVGAEMTETILHRLKFSRADTKIVTSLVKEHMRPLDCGESGVRRIMRDLGEQFERWLLIKRADAPPVVAEEEFEASYARFVEMVEKEHERQAGPVYGKLAIGGDDLLRMGYKEGPLIGKVLAECEELVIEDPEKNTTDELMKIARSHLKVG
ncbi:MAG: HD domain-containing protein [Bdellovibrionales bacterium]|nr:HD domain-containing protein [Bdellovibrionales bacterium]